jgi:hypothetical protein
MEPAKEELAKKDPTGLRSRISHQFEEGLAIEEIIDLWNVIFPKHRNVWYDEDEATVHYSDESEPFQYVD